MGQALNPAINKKTNLFYYNTHMTSAFTSVLKTKRKQNDCESMRKQNENTVYLKCNRLIFEANKFFFFSLFLMKDTPWLWKDVVVADVFGRFYSCIWVWL